MNKYTNSMIILTNILKGMGYKFEVIHDKIIYCHKDNEWRIRADYDRGIIEFGSDKDFDRWANSVDQYVDIKNSWWMDEFKLRNALMKVINASPKW